MKALILLLLFSVCVSPTSALAISNGGFETGDFTNWRGFGPPNLARIETAAFGSGPTGGTFQAFIQAPVDFNIDDHPAPVGIIEGFLGVPAGFVTAIVV